MTVDLSALQAANDALDASEVGVAGDLQALVDKVQSLQDSLNKDSSPAEQAAVDSIATHVNAVISRLAADVAGHTPSTTATNVGPVAAQPPGAPVVQDPTANPTVPLNPDAPPVQPGDLSTPAGGFPNAGSPPINPAPTGDPNQPQPVGTPGPTAAPVVDPNPAPADATTPPAEPAPPTDSSTPAPSSPDSTISSGDTVTVDKQPPTS